MHTLRDRTSRRVSENVETKNFGRGTLVEIRQTETNREEEERERETNRETNRQTETNREREYLRARDAAIAVVSRPTTLGRSCDGMGAAWTVDGGAACQKAVCPVLDADLLAAAACE